MFTNDILDICYILTDSHLHNSARMMIKTILTVAEKSMAMRSAVSSILTNEPFRPNANEKKKKEAAKATVAEVDLWQSYFKVQRNISGLRQLPEVSNLLSPENRTRRENSRG